MCSGYALLHHLGNGDVTTNDQAQRDRKSTEPFDSMQQLIHPSYGEKMAIGENGWFVHRRLGWWPTGQNLTWQLHFGSIGANRALPTDSHHALDCR
jgi:hypothetical protein